MMHWGRAWTGHAIEDNCPCPKAPCGLVLGMWPGRGYPECEQHNPRKPWEMKTMRQSHHEENCPALKEEA